MSPKNQNGRAGIRLDCRTNSSAQAGGYLPGTKHIQEKELVIMGGSIKAPILNQHEDFMHNKSCVLKEWPARR